MLGLIALLRQNRASRLTSPLGLSRLCRYCRTWLTATEPTAIAVVIPPQNTAVPSAGFEIELSPRDTHLLTIASLGRLGWQEVIGYGKRALVETAMGRYKGLIGERLHSRVDAARRTEAVVGAAVLNRMLDAARPNSVRRSLAPA
jgi:hypothetical protein